MREPLFPPYAPVQSRGRLQCYVLGCRQPLSLSTRHRLYGLVASCESHDPSRQGYGADWAPVLPSGAPKRSGPEGGTRVPVTSPLAPISPAPVRLPTPIEF